MIKSIRLKTNEYNHNDDQILNARVSHTIKFTWLKIDEYNYNDDQILKARVSHIIKFTRLKPMSKIILDRKSVV